MTERGNAAEAARARAQATEFQSRTKELATLLGNVANDQLSAWLARKNLKNATDWQPSGADLGMSIVINDKKTKRETYNKFFISA